MAAADVLSGVHQWWIECSDVLDALRAMPSESVHCVVTSVPYYGLRDYGTAQWEGGDTACGHQVRKPTTVTKQVASSSLEGSRATVGHQREGFKGECGRCGAVRIDRQIGLESTPAVYLAKMVEVFAEVRRVLRSDGTLWLNVGDSYNSGTSAKRRPSKGSDHGYWLNGGAFGDERVNVEGLAAKQLLGIPWRLAFALQDAGWWLRCDIVWHKSNPMPESTKDRPTKAHEYLFLMAKSARYYYDGDAIKEPVTGTTHARVSQNVAAQVGNRNKRSVWTIATESFSDAHFATFPTALVEPCILAGTSEHGVCPTCGAPWRRVVGRPCARCGAHILTQGKSCPACGHVNDWKAERAISEEFGTTDWSTAGRATPRKLTKNGKQAQVGNAQTIDAGWEPTCAHGLDPVPAVVLDPFAGSGTTLMVALRHGRRAIGIELNPKYVGMAADRIFRDAPLFTEPMPEAGG